MLMVNLFILLNLAWNYIPSLSSFKNRLDNDCDISEETSMVVIVKIHPHLIGLILHQ